LFAVDDTIFIDGEQVTGQRAVTVNKVLTALLILIIGFWLSAPLKKKAGALSARFFHVNEAEVVLIEKTFHLFLFISLVIFALVTVKIPLTVFAFVGGALAIGVGFASSNLINNFISGVILLLEQPIKIGDIIEIDGMSGHFVSVGARCSQVRRFDGIDILVPNSEFLQKNVVNWTLSDSDLRLSIKFGVAYGSSTRDVTDAARQVLEKHGRILKKPTPQVLFEDFGDSALIFTVRFWVTIDPEFSYRVIASDVRHMLSNKFAEENIVIAFPQQDVHLDAGKPIQISLVPDISPPVPKQPESEE
jgi:potassium efflux system protein